jgi:TPR repeat protein
MMRAQVTRAVRRTAILFAFIGQCWATSVGHAGNEEGSEAYRRGDYTAAFREFKAMADAGDAAAAFNLGWLYDSGKGVPHDASEAAMWYGWAAKKGYPVAQYYFGLMLADGDGIQQDRAEAARWFRRSANQGNRGAQYALGVMYRDGIAVESDAVEAYGWFMLATVPNPRPSNDRDEFNPEEARRALNDLASRLDLSEIGEAERRARAWRQTTE